jgi:hypothetical protein
MKADADRFSFTVFPKLKVAGSTPVARLEKEALRSAGFLLSEVR